MSPADVSVVTVRLHRHIPDLPLRGHYTRGEVRGERLKVRGKRVERAQLQQLHTGIHLDLCMALVLWEFASSPPKTSLNTFMSRKFTHKKITGAFSVHETLGVILVSSFKWTLGNR